MKTACGRGGLCRALTKLAFSLLFGGLFSAKDDNLGDCGRKWTGWMLWMARFLGSRSSECGMDGLMVMV